MLLKFIVTVAAALAGGYLAGKVKLPAAGLIGGMIAVALVNILSGFVYFPFSLRFWVRILAGIYIGSNIGIENIKNLKDLKWAAIVQVVGLAISNIIIAFLIVLLTEMELPTALAASAPAGLQEMVLISADIGGNPSQVAIMQLIRLFSSISVIPILVKWISSLKLKANAKLDADHSQTAIKSGAEESNSTRALNYLIMGAAGLGVGFLFDIIGVPAGAMIGAMAGTLIVSLFNRKSSIPRRTRFFIQCASGAYIGSGIGMEQVKQLSQIIIPAIIMLIVMFIMNICLGLLIQRTEREKLDLTTSMFCCAPGGITDITLAAMDLGCDATKVTSMHLLRSITTVSLLPTLYTLIIRWFG